jgi:hypothetical protein
MSILIGVFVICLTCCADKNVKDFLMGKKECYKCVYERKINKENSKPKINKCRVCTKNCSEHRWVYCSKKCAEIGELKQNREYWFNVIKSV